jgi:putative MFS transporter
VQYRDLLSMYADSRPTPNYIRAYVLFCAGYVLDFFDFFLVGFLLAVMGPTWHLTYGQSSLILLSAGAGAIFGSLFSGALADAFGRKRMLIVSMTLCALGAGAVAFLPDRAWALFAVLRFFVGVGLSGSATTTTVMLVELTPLRYRTRLTGFPLTAASVGSLIASMSAATLIHALGWRGVAAFGFVPIVLMVLVVVFVPESPLWLVSKGRHDQARAAIRKLTGNDGGGLPVSLAPREMRPPTGKLAELLAYPGRTLIVFLTWTALSTTNFGVYLWGPTVVSLMLHISASAAAQYFVVVSIAALLGRVMLSLLPVWISRRKLCTLSGFCIALALAGAALWAQKTLLGYPLFIVFVALGAVFFDGVWVVISPYVVEIFPTRLAARAIGVGQAGNGLGKILGPWCLAVIAGTSHVVTPRATTDALLPAFLFLAGCGLFFGLAFMFLLPDDGTGAPKGDQREESIDAPAAPHAVDRVSHCAQTPQPPVLPPAPC